LRRSGNPANASGWMCFIRFWTRSNSRSRGTVPNAGESKLCRKEECKEIEWIWWNQMAQNPVIVTVVDGILLNEVNLKSHAAEFDKMNLCDETQPSWMDYHSQQLFKEYQESPWKEMERGKMKSFSTWKNLERIPTNFKRETLRCVSFSKAINKPSERPRNSAKRILKWMVKPVTWRSWLIESGTVQV